MDFSGSSTKLSMHDLAHYSVPSSYDLNKERGKNNLGLSDLLYPVRSNERAFRTSAKMLRSESVIRQAISIIWSFSMSNPVICNKNIYMCVYTHYA